MGSMVTEIITGMGWPSSRAQIVDGEHARLDVARVLAGLEQQQIGAALDQAARLVAKVVAKLLEGDATRHADGFGRGPHRSGHEARLGGSREFVGGLPGERGGAAADLVRVLAKAILGKDDGRAPEGIRLDNVRASFEILPVNPEHHVRPGNHEILVAALEVRPAEVFRGQVHLLQHGAHGAIEDEDALAEKFAKGQALLDEVSHVLRIIPWERQQRGITSGPCDVAVNEAPLKSFDFVQIERESVSPTTTRDFHAFRCQLVDARPRPKETPL